jgi:hypothetical protein
MRFLDYNRTVVAFHGTRLSTARAAVLGERPLTSSRNDDDWLGHGIYFWEHAPEQALWWARRRAKRQGWDEPVAVLASMIRLGSCLDLLDPFNVQFLKGYHAVYVAGRVAAGLPVPVNVRQNKRLDCAVFEYTYAARVERAETPIDASRAAYVPTQSRKRVWKGSWIYNEAHIQIYVRNADCILGTWLHQFPAGRAGDAEEAEIRRGVPPDADEP